MMLVPANSANIVPGIGLMAEVALLNPGIVLARHRLRDHLEMMHVVAWRCLVALRTIRRTGRRVFEACHFPGFGEMANRAFATKEVAMRTAVAVTGKAIESLGDQRIAGARNPIECTFQPARATHRG